jgi:hypothetical protein
MTALGRRVQERRHPVRAQAAGRAARSCAKALAALDAGGTRTDIQSKYGVIVGVAGASLSVARGEICVLMGCRARASRRCCARPTA